MSLHQPDFYSSPVHLQGQNAYISERLSKLSGRSGIRLSVIVLDGTSNHMQQRDEDGHFAITNPAKTALLFQEHIKDIHAGRANNPAKSLGLNSFSMNVFYHSGIGVQAREGNPTSQAISLQDARITGGIKGPDENYEPTPLDFKEKLWQNFAFATGKGLTEIMENAVVNIAIQAAEAKSRDEMLLILIDSYSRGGATAKTLCSYLKLIGIPRVEKNAKGDWSVNELDLEKGLDLYRRRREQGIKAEINAFRTGKGMEKNQDFFILHESAYDPVPALGLPDQLRIMNKFAEISGGLAARVFGADSLAHTFHDWNAPNSIPFLTEVLAADEGRFHFDARHWVNSPENADMAQIVSPGGHGNIGGGYAYNGLSDHNLLNMLTRHQKAIDAVFGQGNFNIIPRQDVSGELNVTPQVRVKPDLSDKIYDGVGQGALSGAIHGWFQRDFRSAKNLEVSEALQERIEGGNYAPRSKLPENFPPQNSL